MSDESSAKVWEKLDSIDKRGTDMLLEMSRMGGDQRTAHAEFNGKLNMLTSQMANLEKQQTHDKASTTLGFQQIDGRVNKLEQKTSYFFGKVAGVSAAISIVIAVVGLVLGALGGHH